LHVVFNEKLDDFATDLDATFDMIVSRAEASLPRT